MKKNKILIGEAKGYARANLRFALDTVSEILQGISQFSISLDTEIVQDIIGGGEGVKTALEMKISTSLYQCIFGEERQEKEIRYIKTQIQ